MRNISTFRFVIMLISAIMITTACNPASKSAKTQSQTEVQTQKDDPKDTAQTDEEIAAQAAIDSAAGAKVLEGQYLSHIFLSGTIMMSSDAGEKITYEFSRDTLDVVRVALVSQKHIHIDGLIKMGSILKARFPADKWEMKQLPNRAIGFVVADPHARRMPKKYDLGMQAMTARIDALSNATGWKITKEGYILPKD